MSLLITLLFHHGRFFGDAYVWAKHAERSGAQREVGFHSISSHFVGGKLLLWWFRAHDIRKTWVIPEWLSKWSLWSSGHFSKGLSHTSTPLLSLICVLYLSSFYSNKLSAFGSDYKLSTPLLQLPQSRFLVPQ